MADKTQRAQVLKVALSSTFNHGQDMIRVPQRLAREPLEPPFSEKAQPVGPTRATQLRVGCASVDSADRADAPVPLKNLLAKVARVGAEAPFVDTPIRAECKTPRRDFESTPAAEGPAVAPFRQGGAIRETAWDCPGSAQMLHNIFSIKCFGRFWPASSGWRLVRSEFVC